MVGAHHADRAVVKPYMHKVIEWENPPAESSMSAKQKNPTVLIYG